MKLTIKVLLVLLFIEIVLRILLSFTFNTIIITPKDLYHKYYPELKKVNNYKYQEDKTNLLVLGGSVVSNDVSSYPLSDSNWAKTSYCNFNKLVDDTHFNVLSLAKSAHNSLDSRIKYSLIKNSKFDFVFIYHGLNDNRANNIFDYLFDENYRHIEFYDDLYIIGQAQSNYFLALIFFPKWIYHQKQKKNKKYTPKERFEGLLKNQPERLVIEGNDIKTEKTFGRNYQAIKSIADKRNEKIIVSTYAWYIPKDYSLDKFKKQILDYNQQAYPIELYGLPENIEKGLKIHNEIIMNLARKNTDVLLLDFNSTIEKNKLFFHDICHLTNQGCNLLAKSLIEKIEGDK